MKWFNRFQMSLTIFLKDIQKLIQVHCTNTKIYG